jgi:tRNA pseudouridine32 synthase/23S rRNA pseudouridine746 synthase
MPLEAVLSPSSTLQPLYADDSLLVFDKPAGLLSVPGRGPDKQDCLASRVHATWPDALVVHRLDMPTSGLLLMARGLTAQRALSLAFEQRRVEKRYTAVVSGHLQPKDTDWQVIDLPIAVDWPRRPLRVIDAATGQPSLTRWQALPCNRWPDATRLTLAPVTGRSHQLRVHLLAMGHPILGDALYAPAEVQARAPRLLLHASELTLAHPLSGAELNFTSPAPF